MDIILALADMRVCARLQTVYAFFDDRLAQTKCTADMEEFPYDKAQLKELFGKMFSDPIPNTDVVLIPNGVGINTEQMDDEGKLIWTKSVEPDDLTRKLLHLTIYDSLQIQSKAFAMLFRHRGQKEALVSLMKNACLVVHPDMVVANAMIEVEVQALRPHIKWLSYPASEHRAAAIEHSIKTLSKWCDMCTVGTTIDLGMRTIEVDEFFARKLAENLFNLGGHRYAIKLLDIDIKAVDLTSLQLNDIIMACDVDHNGTMDSDEYQECCKKLGRWVLGDEADIDVHLPSNYEMQAGGELGLSAVQDWLATFFKEAYSHQLDKLWNLAFKVLGLMCIGGEMNQFEIAKTMNITGSSASSILHRNLERSPPELYPFLSQVAKGNGTVCNNFDEGVIKFICKQMLKTKDPTSANVLSDLCRFNGVCCERNVAIVVDCLVGHTDGMTFHVKRGKDGRNKVGTDSEWHHSCLMLLAAFVEGTSPKELEFVQSMVDFDMCVSGICLPFPMTQDIKCQKGSTKKKKKKKAPPAAPPPAPPPAPVLTAANEATLRKLFNRYDLNDNGVIDSQEELTQLTMNSAVKFRIRLSPDSVEMLCSNVEISEFTPWDFEQLSVWFVANVLSVKSETCAVKAESIELSVKDDTGFGLSDLERINNAAQILEVEDKDSSAANCTPATRETLLVKGAYLKLWTQCYANVNEDVTMMMMAHHQTCAPPMASIFPEGRDVEMGCQISVMDAIFQVLTLFARTPDLILDEELVAIVYDGIIPCLTFYLTMHLKELEPDNQKKLTDVLLSLKTFKACSIKKGMAGEDERAAMDGLLAFAGDALDCQELLGGISTSTHALEKDVRQEAVEVTGAMWQKFTKGCINDLELTEDEDDITILGDAVKTLALMLCADEVPGSECKCDPEKCSHRLLCRRVIHNMMDTLTHSGTIELMDAYLICNMLATARAMIYIDRSTTMGDLDENWQHFIDDDEVGKDECMHIKLWSQWKLAELGASDALIVLAGCEDSSTIMASIRFGVTLLEGGNTLVQDQLLVALEGRPQQAAKFITCVCKELHEAKNELSLVMTQGISSGGVMKDMDECEEAFDALMFWQSLTEGHHLGFQRFIGEAERLGVDVFAELEEILEKCTATLMRIEHETVTDLLKKIFDVYKELVEGPCQLNQNELTASEAIANVTSFLFNMDLLDSKHVPHYVDSLRCNPAGTFKAPVQAAHSVLSVDTRLEIKEGIYGLFKSLLDGSTKSVASSLAMHLNPLCLLRDMFAVEPIMLYRTEMDLGTNVPGCVQSWMRKYQRAERQFFNILLQTSDADVAAAEEAEKSFETAGRDPNLLRHIAVAKDAYIVLKYLEEVVPDSVYGDILTLMRSGKEPLWTRYYNTLETRISTAEFTLGKEFDNVTYNYNFRIPDICHHLRGLSSWKSHVKFEMDLIPRDNHSHKQLEFVRCINNRLVEIEHLKELLHHATESDEHGPWASFFLSYIVNRQDFLDGLPFFWAATLTTLLCITYGYDQYDTEAEGGHKSYENYPGANESVHILGFFCVVSSLVLVVKHFIVIVPCQIRLFLRAKREAEDATFSIDGLTLHQTLHGRAAPEFLPGQEPYEQELDMMQFHIVTNDQADEEPDRMTQLKWVLTDPASWYFVGIFFLSFVALCLADKGKFMFALVMLDYMRRPDGQMIMSSVIEGAPGLLGSARVAIVLIMNYACLSWWLFEDEIQHYNDCKTAYQCVMKAVEAGLQGDFAGLHGDAWWNVFQSFPLSIDDKTKKQAQWWFVNSYFVIWNYIIAGIVQGYIVDAFGAIRGAQDSRDEDAQSKCLVCSLDKFALDDAGVPFHIHTEKQHNRWAYLYVASAVEMTPLDEQGTTESLVQSCLSDRRNDFLPLQTCVRVEQYREAAELKAAEEAAEEDDGAFPEEQIQKRLTTIEEQIQTNNSQLALLLARFPAV